MTELGVGGVLTATYTESVQPEIVDGDRAFRVRPPPAAAVIGGAESLNIGTPGLSLKSVDVCPALWDANNATLRHLSKLVLVRLLDSHLHNGLSSTGLLHTGTQILSFFLGEISLVKFETVDNIFRILGNCAVGCAVRNNISIGFQGGWLYVVRNRGQLAEVIICFHHG